MHESKFFYDRTDKLMVLINTVSENKQLFSKRQINGVEQSKTLYANFGYPSVKCFRQIFQSQKIIYCPVIVQDIYISYTILFKNIASLIGKTVRKKQIHMTGDIAEIP